MNSVLGCCRFVTDESGPQIGYSRGGDGDTNPRAASFILPRVESLMPKLFSEPEAIVNEIIREVGKNLVVGLPLGLGKANHIVNALYARAVGDPSINLTLFSALTLEK